MQVEYNTYKNKEFICPECHWQGKGKELVNGEFHELTFIGDLECPKCFHLVAFWQAPLIDIE
jgi:hypothetical protein